MLQISPAQMQAFEEQAARNYADEMWIHMQQFAPALCAAAGEDHVRRAISDGVKRAESHGFTNRGPVRFYLELMAIFGCHFDTDPQHAWAHPHLKGGTADQTIRAERLFGAYYRFSQQSLGDDHSILLSAIRTIRSFDIDAWRQQRNGRPNVAAALNHMYPERIAAMGRAAADRLVHSALQAANRHGATSLSAHLISGFLSLLVGHRYDQDDYYPWIGRTLDPTSQHEPEERFERLARMGLTYLERVSEYWERT